LACIIVVVAGVLGVPGGAQAIGPCSGIGPTVDGMRYGTCVGDLGGGSIVWSSDGSTVTMKAKARPTPQDAVSWWDSNGPLAAGTTLVCFDLTVSALTLKKGATAMHLLSISYDNQPRALDSWSVVEGAVSRCATIPAGATNIWAQLLTVVTAGRSGSSVSLTETVAQLRVS